MPNPSENHQFDLFIAGAQKCGTTSLKNYLGEHPEISVHPQREFGLFNQDSEWGHSEFSSYFPDLATGSSTRLVAKYVSMSQSNSCLERLANHSPNCKIILMVRDPIRRSHSSWRMECVAGGESRSFEDAIDHAFQHPDSWQFRAYVEYGNYFLQLENILNWFPQESVKVVVFEEFISNPLLELKAIFRWLDLNDEFLPKVEIVHNIGGDAKSRMVSRAIRWITRESNILKPLARQLLGGPLSRRAGYKLRELNRKTSVNKEVPDGPRMRLKSYYSASSKQVQMFLGRNENIW